MATRALIVALVTVFSSAGSAQGVNVDWNPTGRFVVLNTESARILTSIGWVTVTGGRFVFRNVTIPAGTTVRGEGKNPLVLVLAGTLKLDGKISVRGANGVMPGGPGQNSAGISALGGEGVCGGGQGGTGSPNTGDRSHVGGAGYGPFLTAGFGGKGGRINCANNLCRIGSAGGGGSFATAGDPWFKVPPTVSFVQPTGRGGYGCNNRWATTLPGGAAGPVYFVDRNPGNDFVGLGVDVNRRILIRGELPRLVGGSGGGGGGDYASSCASRDPNFVGDEAGGGGGAGGGVVCILSQGPIVLGPRACIDASGGHGGGGGWFGSSNRGGGGGGGAGGLVVLYSRTRLDIAVHGETYARNDFDFPISADGGVGGLETYAGGGLVRSKYGSMLATNMNARPSGGFGGLGIIQLMTRPGTTNADGTNTYLDDNIILRRNSTPLTGPAKIRYLAWRGFPNPSGTLVDDFGKPTNIGGSAGDFRPTPILLPVF